jgi:hypothetical protein
VGEHTIRGAGNLPVAGDDSPEALAPAESPVSPLEGARPENAFSEAGSATVAALLNLLRLMGAELVLVRGTNIAQFEHAVRTKIGEFVSPTANQEAREAGLAQARYLVEQVLTQIRAQADLKKNLGGEHRVAAQSGEARPVRPISKLLN